MSFRMAMDIGGTFTDLAVFDEETKDVESFKSFSTAKLVDGVIECAWVAARFYGMDLKELLTRTNRIMHGSTIATNTVIQRKGANTGLITTMGHGSILYRGEAMKEDAFNHKILYPRPLIPQYLCQEIEERINSEGEVEVPLREDSVLAAVHQFKKWKIEAIAVCLLWSIINDQHEQRVKEIIKKEWSEIFVSISSEVQPTIREYQRTCCVVLDAMLKPVTMSYMREFDETLRENGFKGEWFFVTSAGGVVDPSELQSRPVNALYSGPSMGPSTGLLFAEQEGVKSVITVDMGGTSFDVSAIADGVIPVTKSARVGSFPTGMTSIEVLTLGAGGGSIARVDTGGLLHVGPQSAGAQPGPACYAKGGDMPTVTDANIVLGYINPEYYLGGEVKINAKLSLQVIKEKIAKPLECASAEAAAGIHQVVNENMIGGILEMTVRRGIDPREFVIVVGGGAASIHAARIAKELGVLKIIIPKAAPVLCALGMLNSDITSSFSISKFTQSNRFDFEAVNDSLAEIEEKTKNFLAKSKISAKDMRFKYYVAGRYPRQATELEVPLTKSRVTPEMIPQLKKNFDAIYERRYGVADPTSSIEFIDWRAVGIGCLPGLTFKKQQASKGKDPSNAFKGRRSAYFIEEKGAFIETPVYDGNKLACGMEIKGPAIVEDTLTTTLVIPDYRLKINEFHSYVMEPTA